MPTLAEPWTIAPRTESEERELAATAKSLFAAHYDHPAPDPKGCPACQLTIGTVDEPPNYSGWLRIWIEAQMAIPERWFTKEMTYADAEQPSYYEGILRDIATFGLTLSPHRHGRSASVSSRDFSLPRNTSPRFRVWFYECLSCHAGPLEACR